MHDNDGTPAVHEWEQVLNNPTMSMHGICTKNLCPNFCCCLFVCGNKLLANLSQLPKYCRG